ncbi:MULTISPECIES: dTMP kinase [unclassified Thioalkalivibrio]|uniref:dTMP kinase n=1 Tax=unclassified Thioalkalivibrio TaxID=2621013 RepID=UPI0003779E94|nr:MULTISPECIES: dTMP kinase [unclassified Thioalkalivibrio]
MDRSPHPGRFLVLEGIEGSGKTTQIERLEARLRAAGHSLRVTREPGGTALGERLRGLLLDPDLPGMCPEAELLLMFAARAQHLAEIIRPALDAGDWVLSDRFTDASFAYQGAGRGLGDHRVARLEDWLQGELRPDLVILLDIAPETGLERAVQRGRRDRIEREALDFFERAREAYRQRAAKAPNRYLVVDGAADPDTVAERILAGVRERLPLHALGGG